MFQNVLSFSKEYITIINLTCTITEHPQHKDSKQVSGYKNEYKKPSKRKIIETRISKSTWKKHESTSYQQKRHTTTKRSKDENVTSSAEETLLTLAATGPAKNTYAITANAKAFG